MMRPPASHWWTPKRAVGDSRPCSGEPSVADAPSFSLSETREPSAGRSSRAWYGGSL